jgi:uncharacterized protein (TIGR02996 family)
MPEREAFLAAIAAAPADDLPRLVFADWLDENGDPERAAFIRAQVRRAAEWDGPNDAELARTAAELFHTHGIGWCHTLLTALGVDMSRCQLLPQIGIWREAAASQLIVLVLDPSGRTTHLVLQLNFQRGFVHELSVTVANALPGTSFAAAFRHEPIHALTAHFGSTVRPDGWIKLSEPALRRISRLAVEFHPDVAAVTPAMLSPVFTDSHLAGVRQFRLSPHLPGMADARIPPETLAAFTRSPLAYRLDALELEAVDDDSIRALCRNTQLNLEKLTLNGAYTRDALTPLQRSGIAESVRSLTLFFNEPDDISAFARSRWPKLTELHLSCHIDDGGTFPEGGLRALAAAEFLPQLEVLDLSDNWLVDASSEAVGLRDLAAALDPDRLRLLNLTNTGLEAVPDFLADRFGERVAV